MKSHGKIYMYIQCIEDGRYQVFIKNEAMAKVSNDFKEL